MNNTSFKMSIKDMEDMILKIGLPKKHLLVTHQPGIGAYVPVVTGICKSLKTNTGKEVIKHELRSELMFDESYIEKTIKSLDPSSDLVNLIVFDNFDNSLPRVNMAIMDLLIKNCLPELNYQLNVNIDLPENTYILIVAHSDVTIFDIVRSHMNEINLKFF
jgi:hypothetical protein